MLVKGMDKSEFEGERCMDVFLKLKKKRTIRRIVEGVITVLSLIALITFNVLKENSKVIEKIEVTPFLSYDNVYYTKDYSVAFLIFGLIFALSVSALVADFIATRIYYKEIDGEDIIVYNGMRWTEARKSRYLRFGKMMKRELFVLR